MENRLELSRTDLVIVDQNHSYVNVGFIGEREIVHFSFNKSQIDQFINMLRAAKRRARTYDIENMQLGR